MLPRAENPDTGEVMFYTGEKWAAPSQIAENDSGQKAYLIGNQWIIDAPPEPPAAPEKPEPKQASVGSILPDVWEAVKNVPSAVAGAGAMLYQGNDPKAIAEESSISNRIIENARANAKEQALAEGAEDTYTDFLGFKIKRSDVRNLPQNLAFSVTSMGAGILAGIGVGVATTAATAGTGPAAPVLGLMAGITAGRAVGAGAAAYRMDTNSFLRDFRDSLNESAKQQLGRPLTNSEFAAIAESPQMQEAARDYGVSIGGSGAIKDLASEHGMHEAAWEGLGNAVGIGAGKYIFKEALKGKIIKPLAVGAAETGLEIGTETATQMGQQRVESRAGMTDEIERSWGDLGDWRKSYEEVAGPTLLNQLVMAGAPAAAGRVVRALRPGETDTEQPPGPQVQGANGQPLPAQPLDAAAQQQAQQAAAPVGQPAAPDPKAVEARAQELHESQGLPMDLAVELATHELTKPASPPAAAPAPNAGGASSSLSVPSQFTAAAPGAQPPTAAGLGSAGASVSQPTGGATVQRVALAEVELKKAEDALTLAKDALPHGGSKEEVTKRQQGVNIARQNLKKVETEAKTQPPVTPTATATSPTAAPPSAPAVATSTPTPIPTAPTPTPATATPGPQTAPPPTLVELEEKADTAFKKTRELETRQQALLRKDGQLPRAGTANRAQYDMLGYQLNQLEDEKHQAYDELDAARKAHTPEAETAPTPAAAAAPTDTTPASVAPVSETPVDNTSEQTQPPTAAAPQTETPETQAAVTEAPVAKKTRAPGGGRKKIDRTPEQVAQIAANKQARTTSINKGHGLVGQMIKWITKPPRSEIFADVEGAHKGVEKYAEGRAERLTLLQRYANHPKFRDTRAGERAREFLASDAVTPNERVASLARHEIWKKENEVQNKKASRTRTKSKPDVAYRSFKNAGEALDYIIKTGTVFERLLARRLKGLVGHADLMVVKSAEELGDPDFEGAHGMAVMHGYSDEGVPMIVLLDQRAGSEDHGINNQVFLHEALHIATMGQLYTYEKNSRLGIDSPDELTMLYNSLAGIMQTARQRYNELKLTGWKPSEDLQHAIDAGALRDVHEFVSYGYTLPDMQDFLLKTDGSISRGTKMSMLGNLFNKFVNAIRRSLGMDASHMSAMQDLVLVTEAIIQRDEKSANIANDDLTEVKLSTLMSGGGPKSTAEGAKQEIMNFIGSNYNRKIQVVQAYEELPQEVKDVLESETGGDYDVDPDSTQGFVIGQGSKARAYLIANNIPEEHAVAVFMHEVGVHLGMTGILGQERMHGLGMSVMRWAESPEFATGDEHVLAKRAIARVGHEINTAEDREEVIAYFLEEAILAGHNPQAANDSTRLGKWLRSVYAAFKAAVRKFTTTSGGDWSAQDLLDMAYGAARLEMNGRWHGTGQSYSKFRTDKIGSGENAQVFGWGLYFAQRAGIGKNYWASDVARKTKRTEAPLDWAPANLAVLKQAVATDVQHYEKRVAEYQRQSDDGILSPIERKAARGWEKLHANDLAQSQELLAWLDSPQAARMVETRYGPGEYHLHIYVYPQQLGSKEVWRVADTYGHINNAEGTDIETRVYKTPEEAFDTIADSGEYQKIETIKPEGDLHRIDLAVTDDELLDWDKPLSEQSDLVKKAIEQLPHEVQVKLDRVRDNEFNFSTNTTGEKLYEILRTAVKDPNVKKDPGSAKRASLALYAAGIKGIHYLDQNSRGSQDSLTSNTIKKREVEERLRMLRKAVSKQAEFIAKHESTSDVADTKKSMAIHEAAIAKDEDFLDYVNHNLADAKQALEHKATRNIVVFDESDVIRVVSHANADQKRVRFSRANKSLSSLEEERKNAPPPDPATVQANAALPNTKSPAAVGAAAKQLAPQRNMAQVLSLLAKTYFALPARAIHGLFWGMATKDILHLADEVAPKQMVEAMRDTERSIGKLNGSRQNVLNKSDETAEKLASILRKNKGAADLLHTATSRARILNVSPVLYSSVHDALTKDVVLAALDKELQNPLGKPQTQKQIDGLKQARADRVLAIREVWGHWDKLGAVKGLQDVYKEMRTFYKTMFSLRRMLLDKKIAALEIDAPSKKKLMAELQQMYEKEVPEEYFPLMRHGDYWLRMKDKNGERLVKAFDSEKERARFVAAKAKQMGVTRKELFESYDAKENNDLLSVEADLRNSSALLKNVFEKFNDTLESSKDKNGVPRITKAKLDDLKDDIYQFWLSSGPEASIRKQFLHADKVPGFSEDVLRNFSVYATRMSGEIGKLRYGDEIRASVQRAKDILEGDPDQAKLRMFATEIESRAHDELQPPGDTWLGGVFNKIGSTTYFFVMTGAASAISQSLSLPTIVAPALGGTYGFKATAVLGKYTRLITHRAFTGLVSKTDNGDIKFTTPSLGETDLVKNNPLLKRAFDAFTDRRAVFDTFTRSVIQRGAMPSNAYAHPTRRFMNFAANTMSAAFNASEQATREITLMATFELEYAKNKDFDKAVDIAIERTREYLSSNESFDRARAFRNPVMKLVGQFKQYPITMISLLMRNAYNIIRIHPEAGARTEAMKMMTGTLMMAGLFAGVRGLPLYDIVTDVVTGYWKLSADDDDKKRMRRRKNPLMADDAKKWFEHVYLPETFGTDKFLTNAVRYGPVSALTGANVGTHTGLNGLLFRQADTGKDAKETITNWLSANLMPSAQKGGSFLHGLQQVSEGDMEKGLANMTPPFIKNFITAHRIATEGETTGRGKEVMGGKRGKPEEKFGVGEVASQILGFQPTRLAAVKDLNRDITEEDVQATRSKTNIHLLVAKALDTGEREYVTKAMNLLRQHDRRFGPNTPFFVDPISISNQINEISKGNVINFHGQRIDIRHIEKYAPVIRMLRDALPAPR